MAPDTNDRFLTGDREIDAVRLAYLILIAVITLLAVAGALVYYLVPNQAVRQVLIVMDTVYAFVLLADFFIRLRFKPDKRRYVLRGGWLDFLGSLPGIPFLRFLRLVRVVRSTRLILAETPREVARMAREVLAESVLLVTGLVAAVVVTVGSIGVVLVEGNLAEANIKTGYDAVWWSLVTVATVGYGDRYPVTGWGRIIGTFMIVVGVALFTTLTSYLASKLSNRSSRKQRQVELDLLARNSEQFDTLLQRLGELEEKLARASGSEAPPQERE